MSNGTSTFTTTIIPNLPAGVGMSATDVIPVDQSGHTVKLTAQQIQAFMLGSNLTANTLALNAPANVTALSIITGGTGLGFNITQVGPTSFTQTANQNFAYNSITVTNNNVNANPPNYHSTPLEIQISSGLNTSGSQYGIEAVSNLQAAQTLPVGDFIGGSFGAIAFSPNGGTNTGAGASGSLYGLQAFSVGHSTATNYFIWAGAEFDVINDPGATVSNRFGIDIVTQGNAQEAVRDASIIVLGTTGSAFKTGLQFSNFFGGFPITTTLISTEGAATLTSGIDFSSCAFSGNSINLPHFAVAGTGQVISGCTVTGSQNVVLGGNATPGIFLSPSSGSTKFGQIFQSGDNLSFGAAGTGVWGQFALANGTLSLTPAVNSTCLNLTTSGLPPLEGVSPGAQGFNITQTTPNTGSQTNGNYFLNQITCDTGVNMGGGGFTIPLLVQHNIHSNSTGQQCAVYIRSFRNFGATTNMGDQIGIETGVQTNASDGGTNTGAGAHGTIFGANPTVGLLSGAVNYYEACGMEIDIGISSGASSRYRLGLGIVSSGGAGVNGAQLDAAIAVQGTTGGSPSQWGYGLLFSNTIQAGTGSPVTGTLIGSDSAGTVTTGIDLSTYTFSSYMMRFSTTFAVAGNGQIQSGYAGGGSANILLGGSTTPGVLFQPSSGATKLGQIFQSADNLSFGASGTGVWQQIALANGNTSIFSSTASTSSSTGALVVTGGVGIGGALFTGSTVTVGTNLTVNGGFIQTGHVNAAGGLLLDTAGNASVVTVTGSAVLINSCLELNNPNTLSGTSGSMAATDSSVIVNASGTFTLTLQAAATYPGRLLFLKSLTAQIVNSASSNVVPIASTTAGTAIFTATAGKWAVLQSNGTNWVIMAGN